jgi:hypothetical protein
VNYITERTIQTALLTGSEPFMPTTEPASAMTEEVECGTPSDLFAKTNSPFRGICDKSGIGKNAIRGTRLGVNGEWIE